MIFKMVVIVNLKTKITACVSRENGTDSHNNTY